MKIRDANIALMMIVKNEAKTLPRLIESVRPLIGSWRIIDTGSTDGTQQLVHDLLGDLPGELIERPWVNFGHNRSELVKEFPKSANYALLLDADQIVEFDEDVCDQDIPQTDVLMIPVHEKPVSYRMAYFIKRGLNYFYVGATHEYLHADKKMTNAHFDGIRINHVADGGAKADKYERDEKLLLDDIAAGNESSRTYFYLGQTQSSLAKFDESITNYQKAFESSDWIEERYMSCLRAGRVAVDAGYKAAALEWFMRGAGLIPLRPECTFEAAKLLADLGSHQAAVDLLQPQIARMKRDSYILFLEDWIYDWGIQNQLAVSLWWIGEKVAAKKLFESTLTAPNLPEYMIERIQGNIAQC
jgi:tetratricopeptide (TPR) repeat protein